MDERDQRELGQAQVWTRHWSTCRRRTRITSPAIHHRAQPLTVSSLWPAMAAIAGDRGGGVQVAGQVRRQVPGVGGGAVDEARLAATKKWHADQVKTRPPGYPAVMDDPALAVKHRNVEPGQVRTKAGGPDDGADLTAS